MGAFLSRPPWNPPPIWPSHKEDAIARLPDLLGMLLEVSPNIWVECVIVFTYHGIKNVYFSMKTFVVWPTYMDLVFGLYLLIASPVPRASQIDAKLNILMVKKGNVIPQLLTEFTMYHHIFSTK